MIVRTLTHSACTRGHTATDATERCTARGDRGSTDETTAECRSGRLERRRSRKTQNKISYAERGSRRTRSRRSSGGSAAYLPAARRLRDRTRSAVRAPRPQRKYRTTVLAPVLCSSARVYVYRFSSPPPPPPPTRATAARGSATTSRRTARRVVMEFISVYGIKKTARETMQWRVRDR